MNLKINQNIVNYSGFKPVINTYISKYKKQQKRIWNAVDAKNNEELGRYGDVDIIYEYVKLVKKNILWELKYQERMNNIIKKKFYQNIYIWRSILFKIKYKFHDDICVNIIKYLLK